MIRWDKGRVVEICYQDEQVQELLVVCSGETTRAIHYISDQPPVRIGDQVLLNTTAVELGLGTGGVHFVHSICWKTELHGTAEETNGWMKNGGHIVKMRYTPLQRAVLAAEEQESPYHSLFNESASLEGMPVLIGELHSMLPIAACWLRYAYSVVAEPGESRGRENPCSVNLLNRAPRIVYVMTDGGALPMAISRHIRILEKLGWLAGTVTYGNAYGGGLETVNKFSALLAAKQVYQADIIIVTMGPGIVGTGTVFGHSGLEVGELVNAVHALDGVPVVIPRVSFTESRLRHRGISHHTLTALERISLAPARVPLPAQLPPQQKELLSRQIVKHAIDQKHQVIFHDNPALEELEASLLHYPSPITTMGRGLREDTPFFLSAAAAADYAMRCCLRE